jgi:excisionase family DNA binding protein
MMMYKVSDVAKMFNVKPATVRIWLSNGTLSGIKIGSGHYWRIPEDSVTKLAERRYGDDRRD